MSERSRQRDPGRLDQPRESRGWRPSLPGNQDTFGRFAERFARWMGTAQFLVWMTVIVIIWITINLVGLYGYRFDPYPFILLNLFFSTQASYAAPLILLAQNRQDDRDRVALEQDRARDERNLADTEFLTREVASLRIAMRDMATRDYLRGELRDLLEEMEQRLDERGLVPLAETGDGAEGADGSGKRKGAKSKPRRA